MAFPTIQGADTQNGTQTSNSTSWTLTYPTNLASGDLILCFVAIDGNPGAPTFPANWLRGSTNSAGAVTIVVAKKLSLGTESGTFTMTTGSEQGSWRIYRITGWEGTLGTGVVLAPDATNGAIEISSITGVSNIPNPLTLNPGNWDVEDTLWFGAMAADTSRTVSVYPLADNNTADVSGGAGGATLGMCSTTSATDFLNPSTYTISASDEWACLTVAVRPAALLPGPPVRNRRVRAAHRFLQLRG